ncbi:hypothetical protein GRI39_09505 [Altererythrobacter indicus]|uniref:Uncharacterized protein n=1 Tax=Altericroceibacterium indicum TaxID=374177 RepID=A0A845A7S2_9SPHN|nr:hypothetical protein [Altericroceibacterium indicum]MXP26270.1 hypothetical protein [Altericroceibacterium indicum]
MAEPIDSEAPSKSNAKWLWLALIVLFAVLAIIWIADPTTPVEEVTDQNVPAAASDAERQNTLENYPVETAPAAQSNAPTAQ